MSRLCEGRVALVTRAGRGIGRKHALSLASHGAQSVVVDHGAGVDGEGADVSDFEHAGEMVHQVVDAFGRLDILVNNAGIPRDRMLVNMEALE